MTMIRSCYCLFLASVVLLMPCRAFVVMRPGGAIIKIETSTTTLFYRNETQQQQLDGVINHHHHPLSLDERREQLKQDLAIAAIEKYDMEAFSSSTTTTEAEEIMKQLEPLCPFPQPAHHADLNARWSFVFTGVSFVVCYLIFRFDYLIHFMTNNIQFIIYFFMIRSQPLVCA